LDEAAGLLGKVWLAVGWAVVRSSGEERFDGLDCEKRRRFGGQRTAGKEAVERE